MTVMTILRLRRKQWTRILALRWMQWQRLRRLLPMTRNRAKKRHPLFCQQVLVGLGFGISDQVPLPGCGFAGPRGRAGQIEVQLTQEICS